MMTRLEDFRARESLLRGDAQVELKGKDGVFKPNLFTEIVGDGLRIWSEDGGSVVVPDLALVPLKTRITWLTGKAT